MNMPLLALGLLILALWSIVWKSLGLWYSARKNDKLWFIIFIIVNLVGILPIIYLYLKTDFFKKADKKIHKMLNKK